MSVVMILMHRSFGTVVFFVLFSFYLGFMAHQDYFTHFELSQSCMGRKWEILEKNHLTTLKQKFHVSSSHSLHMKPY